MVPTIFGFDLKMVDKTQNIAKWVAAVASVIAIACVVGLIVMLSTKYQCPVTDHPCSTESPQSEIAVMPNLTNNTSQQDPSHPTPSTGIFESPSFSITEAETYESDETRTNTSLDIKGRSRHLTNDKTELSNDSEKAVNEIKSKIRKILTTITSNGTDQEKDFQNKVTKLMLYIVSETNPNIESSMIKTLSKIVSDERKSQVASPVETPSNEFQTSSDIAMVNILETIMNGTYEKESESLAIEADSDIVELKITNFITSIVSQETNPIAKRKIFDVLSVIVRKERDQYMSSLGETDISTINSQMEDNASYATRTPSGKQVPSTVDETEKQIKSFTLDMVKAVQEISSSQIDDSVNDAKSLKLDIIKQMNGIASTDLLQGTKVYTLLISYSIRENTTWMLDFEKQVAGFGSSHIASSNDKTKLVDLNIEKKINGIGFVNTKDVSPDTNPKENNYFLDFQKETTGIGSAYVRPESTSLQPYKNNESPNIEREVTGIGFSTDPANTNSVPVFEREVTGMGFSTDPANTNGVPNLEREVTGIGLSTVTSDENKKMLFIEKKFDGIVSSKIGDSVNDAKPLKLSVNKEVKGIGLSNIKESPANKN